MNPAKVDRARLKRLVDLPNVGPATARDLVLLGYSHPDQIVGACPFEMYRRLCALTGKRHDPCVIDVFMSITEFLQGAPARPWWACTPARQAALAETRPEPGLPLQGNALARETR